MSKCEKNLQGKVYENISELPIYCWWKIHESYDYSHLLHGQRGINKYENLILSKRWEKVYDTYLARFGFAEEVMKIHKQRVKVAKLKVKRMETKDRKLNTPIKIAEHELSELLRIRNEQEKSDFAGVKAIIEEQRGIYIDDKKVTTLEFFTYVEILKKRKPNGRGQG